MSIGKTIHICKNSHLLCQQNGITSSTCLSNVFQYDERSHPRSDGYPNPFAFTFIQNLKSIDLENFDDSGPSVVFASPGMLQSGVSRQLFDRWATDPKNGVLIAGYAVEHTLAKEIMNQPKEVVTLEGRRQPLNCLVDYVSFSAHVDFVQNRSFIAQVDPKHIILVHGQKDEMGRLKSALMLQYRQLPENKRPTITMPPNLQEVKLKFARRRSAKVMGSLADRDGDLQEAEEVKGIMVTHNFSTKIVAPEDLATYTPLRVGSIASKLHVPFAGSVDTLKLFLNEMFVGVTQTTVTNDDNDYDDKDSIAAPATATTVFGLSDDQIKVTVGGKTRASPLSNGMLVLRMMSLRMLLWP
ncbi:Pre-mRNA 3'-end-processing endonuclease polyadenylation factor C-term [Fragilaria crotonensis]|nr:Pre-mRNA 3'-end-processing endonuclease polyadenylation factor C-term [Fragilaria crotonensis]